MSIKKDKGATVEEEKPASPVETDTVDITDAEPDTESPSPTPT